MRILQVIPYFTPAHFFGGPVQVVYDISRELVKRGHEVVVYTSDARDLSSRLSSDREEKMDGIRVHRFRNLSMITVSKSKLFITPGMIPELRKQIQGFDVIHLQEYRAFQSVISHRYAKKCGKPFVLQAHGSVLRTTRKGRNEIYDILFGHSLLEDASRVIALTESEAQQYKDANVPNDKIEIIPNGVVLSKYADLPAAGSFKKRFNIDDDKRIILYLGRIHKIKGIDLLVKAYAQCIKNVECKNVVLAIVGPDDGYLSELRALIRVLQIKDKVLILGPIYGRDKLGAYVDADLFALTSRYETFPMSVLESVACGTPVLLTENCGLGEYLRGKVGVVVRPDPDHILRALLGLMLNRRKNDVFRRNCKAVIKEFDISNIVKRHEEVYETLTQSVNRKT